MLHWFAQIASLSVSAALVTEKFFLGSSQLKTTGCKIPGQVGLQSVLFVEVLQFLLIVS